MSGAGYPASGGPAPGQYVATQQYSGPPAQSDQNGRQMLRGTAQVSSTPSQGEEYYEPYPHGGYPEQRRRLGPWLVAAGAAGVAVLLVIIAVGAASGWFSGKPDEHRTTPASTHTDAGQPIRDDSVGYTASLPKAWQSAGNAKYADPQDKTAWIQFLHRGINVSSARFLRGAGNGLAKNGAYRNYHEIGLNRGVTMAGQSAAELEYTLTDAKTGQRRHGIWRVTVRNGSTYEVYMSVPQDLFKKDKPVFDQAVKSFKIS